MNLPQIRLPHDIMQKVKEKNVRHTLNGLKHLNKKKMALISKHIISIKTEN